MKPSGSFFQGNKKLISELDHFSDSKINQKIDEEQIDLNDKNIEKSFVNLNQNYENNEKAFLVKHKPNSTSIITAASIELEKVNEEQCVKTNNTRKDAFNALMIFLKQFLKEKYDIDLETFKCDEVLGVGIAHMKKVLGLEIYQILCYYPENAIKILKVIENPLINKSEKLIFFYFMTSTYEELYNRYISGDINFPLFKNGNLRINSFITLKKNIQLKKEKLKKKKKSDIFIEKTIKEFEKFSKNMINDIKSGDLERKERNEKKFYTFEFEVFENMRKYFEDIKKAKHMEIEE